MNAISTVPIQVAVAQLLADGANMTEADCPHQKGKRIQVVMQGNDILHLTSCPALTKFLADETSTPQCGKLNRVLRGNGCPFAAEDKVLH